VSPLIVNNPPTAKRSVYVFGANSHGQLGLGHAEANVTQPTLNTNLTKDTVGVVDLAAGGRHCVALTHDNRILTWGDNSDGQLGRETQAQQEPTPAEVDFTTVGLPAETVFVQVTATESATFVLTEFGDVYGWGTFRVCLLNLQSII
jgi:regulator of chromosome condensation